MDKITSVKILGLISSAVVLGANLVSDWVDEQKMDAKIEEKVNAAMAEYESKEEES